MFLMRLPCTIKYQKLNLKQGTNKVLILLHKPHDTALYVLFAACGKVSPLSA